MTHYWIVAEVHSGSGDWDPEYFELEDEAKKRFKERSIGAYNIYLLKIMDRLEEGKRIE